MVLHLRPTGMSMATLQDLREIVLALRSSGKRVVAWATNYTTGTYYLACACDEILLCTPREHHEHWHRHSLPKRIRALDIPVSVIPPDSSGWSYEHGFPDDWVRIEVGPLT